MSRGVAGAVLTGFAFSGAGEGGAATGRAASTGAVTFAGSGALAGAEALRGAALTGVLAAGALAACVAGVVLFAVRRGGRAGGRVVIAQSPWSRLSRARRTG